VFSTPTVAGELLVAGSCNGLIRALDKKTGHVQWEYDIRRDGEQSQFHGDPLITDDLVVIGTGGTLGHVYAFDRATGAVRWKYKVEATGVASDIVRLENQIFFVTIANDLVCLDLQSGKPKWFFHDAYSPQEHCVTCASPAVSDGRVYFGGRNGFAYAVDSQSGRLIWKKDLGADVTTSAAVDHHNLYVGTSKRHLYRLSTDSGAVLTDLPTESAPHRRLIIANDSLFVFLGDEIFASFDLDLKKLRWSAEASKQWTSARPYLWQDAVLAGNRRELIALRASDGTREWSFQFPETVRGIGTTPDILYIGTLAGPVFAYSPKP
jgi:eukaryotic-like serine/threonine-protein kinase